MKGNSRCYKPFSVELDTLLRKPDAFEIKLNIFDIKMSVFLIELSETLGAFLVCGKFRTSFLDFFFTRSIKEACLKFRNIPFFRKIFFEAGKIGPFQNTKKSEGTTKLPQCTIFIYSFFAAKIVFGRSYVLVNSVQQSQL